MKSFVKILILSAGVANCTLGQLIQITNYYPENPHMINEKYFVTDTSTNVLDGSYTSYHINGKIKSEGLYKSNQPMGVWKYYHRNGNLKMTGALKNNSNYGLWSYYFENGSKNMEGELYEGRREGIWKFHYESGGEKSSGPYKSSIKHGSWTYFYERGELKAEAFYLMGRGIYKEYYATGELQMEGLNVGERATAFGVSTILRAGLKQKATT